MSFVATYHVCVLFSKTHSIGQKKKNTINFSSNIWKGKKTEVTYFAFTILESLRLHCYKIIPNNLTPWDSYFNSYNFCYNQSHNFSWLSYCLFIYSNAQWARQSLPLLLSSVLRHLQFTDLFLPSHSFRSLFPLLALPFTSYNMHRGPNLELKHFDSPKRYLCFLPRR